MSHLAKLPKIIGGNDEIIKVVFLLVCCALALTACGSPSDPDLDPEPNTLPVSGTIEGVPAGTDLAGETIEAQNGSGDVLGTATVNTDGTFSVTFSEPTAAQLDLGTSEGLRSQAAATGYDCDSLDIEPGTVKDTVVTELTLPIGVIRGGSDLATATAWADGSSTITDGTIYTFIYVDGDVTITGTNCLRASGINLYFTAELVTGWNIIAIGKTAASTSAAVIPLSDLSKIKWF